MTDIQLDRNEISPQFQPADKPEIILASKSPRRKDILKQVGLNFSVYPADIDEKGFENLTPEKQVVELALKKSWKIALENREQIVVGCDTIVVYKEKVLGQPVDEKDALDMLKTLNNTTHRVLSGLAIIQYSSGKNVSGMEESFVTFRNNSEEEIFNYIKTGEPFDKAGSYAIQGKGKSLVKSYKGCYHNIVGFPLELFLGLLEKNFTVSVSNPLECCCTERSYKI